MLGRSIVLTMFVALMGCGSAADSTYNGDVLYSASGVLFSASGALSSNSQALRSVPISTTSSLDANALRVAILWADARDNTGTPRPSVALVATETAVSGKFPAKFVVDFVQEPIAEIMYGGSGGDAYALGFAVAYVDCTGNKAFDPPPDSSVASDCAAANNAYDLIYGIDETHQIFYTSTNITPGSPWGRKFRAESVQKAGFTTATSLERESSYWHNDATIVGATCSVEGEETQTFDFDALYPDGFSDGLKEPADCTPYALSNCVFDISRIVCAAKDRIVALPTTPAELSIQIHSAPISLAALTPSTNRCDAPSASSCGQDKGCYGVCLEICWSGGLCAGGSTCFLSDQRNYGYCVADGTAPVGYPCSEDVQCQSGHCNFPLCE